MNIKRLTFISSDKRTIVDGEQYIINIENIEPKNLRAIQWFGDSESPWGEFEYDGKNNEQFFDFNLIHAIYDLWLQAKEEAEEKRKELEKQAAIEAGKYDVLRAAAYPSISDQVAVLMNVLSKLIEKNIIEITPEINKLLTQIDDVKTLYPKDSKILQTQNNIKKIVKKSSKPSEKQK